MPPTEILPGSIFVGGFDMRGNRHEFLWTGDVWRDLYNEVETSQERMLNQYNVIGKRCCNLTACAACVENGG